MKEEYLKILQTIDEISDEEFSQIWNEELKEFDGVGPNAKEFLQFCERIYFENKPQSREKINTFDQKFTSGFFIFKS